FAEVESDDIPIAIDGCGVPAFFLSLHRTAYAYARLMAAREGSASQVVEAMTSFPYYVGGAWTITTPLMEAFGGELLAKEGAEGFYAIGIAPAMAATLTDRLKVADDTAIAIALKIQDGSMTRGRKPVIVRT